MAPNHSPQVRLYHQASGMLVKQATEAIPDSLQEHLERLVIECQACLNDICNHVPGQARVATLFLRIGACQACIICHLGLNAISGDLLRQNTA